MKLLCILEKKVPEIAEPIIAQANKFENVDLVKSLWDDPSVSDFGAIIRRIEANGPNNEPIPEGFIENTDAELLVGSFCPFSDKGMDVFDNLKIIGVIRSGLENIDVQAATDKGILVVNAAGRNADAVSDYTVGMLLAEARNIARSHHSVVSGGWQTDFSSSKTTPDLRGKTVGLFGFGYIGRLVAEKLSGFHVNVIVFDPYISEEAAKEAGVTLVEKDKLFTEADFVSIHARLTEDTYHIIGADDLNKMKSTAYFVNTARAGLVDYEALYQALATHKIAGAALDVFDDEPLAEDSPFRKLDNLTMTTHRAGATLDAANNSPRLVFERIRNVIAGVPTQGVVNPQILSSEAFDEWRKQAKSQLGL